MRPHGHALVWSLFMRFWLGDAGELIATGVGATMGLGSSGGSGSVLVGSVASGVIGVGDTSADVAIGDTVRDPDSSSPMGTISEAMLHAR